MLFETFLVYFMNIGGFLDNNSGGGGARIVADIPFNNNANSSSNSNNKNNNNSSMPTGAISQPRLVPQSLAKTMFNSAGLSLALVSEKKHIKNESFVLSTTFF